MKIFRKDGHLRTEALLLLAENELDAGDKQLASHHLAECAACCAEQISLVVAMPPDALSRHQQTSLGDPEEGRKRLLAALQRDADGAGENLLAGWLHPRRLLQIAAVAALLLIAFSFRSAYSPTATLMSAWEETGPEPNHALTPGAANPVQLADICALTDDELDPPVSAEKQRAVFQTYGMTEKTAHAYQVDYLINPQLGGNDQLENLWPEPYHATVWNADAKDALETRLHGMVCSGRLSLEVAQHDLSTDWIAAYKKYFATSRPPVAQARRSAPSQRSRDAALAEVSWSPAAHFVKKSY